MEQEAFFLYVAYVLKELPLKLEGRKELREFVPIIKRAGLRRPERDTDAYVGHIFKRVPVDFDPSGKQMGFVVYIRTKVEDPYSIIKKNYHFVEITETEIEAKAVALKTEQNNGSGFLEKGQKLDAVLIEPILISEF